MKVDCQLLVEVDSGIRFAYTIMSASQALEAPSVSFLTPDLGGDVPQRNFVSALESGVRAIMRKHPEQDNRGLVQITRLDQHHWTDRRSVDCDADLILESKANERGPFRRQTLIGSEAKRPR